MKKWSGKKKGYKDSGTRSEVRILCILGYQPKTEVDSRRIYGRIRRVLRLPSHE